LITSMMVFMEKDWPVNTGGMPIVAWWPNLIIMFEMTMLAGILCTVGTLIVTSGLVRRRPAFYDPAVSDGLIMVGVENASDQTARAAEAALQTSATVKTI